MGIMNLCNGSLHNYKQNLKQGEKSGIIKKEASYDWRNVDDN